MFCSYMRPWFLLLKRRFSCTCLDISGCEALPMSVLLESTSPSSRLDAWCQLGDEVIPLFPTCWFAMYGCCLPSARNMLGKIKNTMSCFWTLLVFQLVLFKNYRVNIFRCLQLKYRIIPVHITTWLNMSVSEHVCWHHSLPNFAMDRISGHD
jgi:hypothetical protein